MKNDKTLKENEETDLKDELDNLDNDNKDNEVKAEEQETKEEENNNDGENSGEEVAETPDVEEEPSIVDSFVNGDIDKVRELIHKQVVRTVAKEIA